VLIVVVEQSWPVAMSGGPRRVVRIHCVILDRRNTLGQIHPVNLALSLKASSDPEWQLSLVRLRYFAPIRPAGLTRS
jgi:hypothetical protein